MSSTGEPTEDLARSRAAAEARRRAFIDALPLDLQAREADIAIELTRMKGPRQAKLGKLYRLMGEISNAASPFVGCKAGCSSCCRMNVSITEEEAQRLGKATGRKPMKLTTPQMHPPDAFVGQACPFLKNNRCSVYDDRPYACRAHFSFDTTPYWCDPVRTMNAELPIVGFSGARFAYELLAGEMPLGGFADIRDFFPA